MKHPKHVWMAIWPDGAQAFCVSRDELSEDNLSGKTAKYWRRYVLAPVTKPKRKRKR